MKNPDIFWITYVAGRPSWHKSFTLGGVTERLHIPEGPGRQ